MHIVHMKHLICEKLNSIYYKNYFKLIKFDIFFKYYKNHCLKWKTWASIFPFDELLLVFNGLTLEVR